MFYIAGALIFLLIGVEHSRAQSCVPVPAQGATPTCPAVTQIEVIGSGFTGGLYPAGPYEQFAIPHSVLTSPAPEAISAITGALCGTIPFPPAAALCASQVALEFVMWKQTDEGQGVIANFYWDWIFAGAWTFSPIPSNNCPTPPPGLLQMAGDPCNVNSDCQSGLCMQPGPCNTSNGDNLCPAAACFGSSPFVNIKTQLQYFLTATHGGGVGGVGAMNTNCTQAQSWETFSCLLTYPNQLALQTTNGQYVTAVLGGGLPPPPNPFVPTPDWQIDTNRVQASCWETFQIITTDVPQCTIKVNSGNFLTAVNGGGYGNDDPGNVFPIHTNATQQGPFETFTLIPAQ